MVDRDAYREQSRANWSRVAPTWEERREWLQEITRPVNDWLLEGADPQPGQTILELACGAGDLGFQLAERVGTQGRVLSTDFAPGMVDIARRHGEARGLTNVEHRVLDAERMNLEDDSVDAVVCRWGYMLMADAASALRETRRVLRDGGSLAFAVWAAPDRNPWAAVPTMTLVKRGHMPAPEPGTPGIFAMADPSNIRELLSSAGFGEPKLEEIALRFRYAGFDDLWDTLTRHSPLSAAITELPANEQHATRAAIKENIAPYLNTDGSLTTPGVTWAVLVR